MYKTKIKKTLPSGKVIKKGSTGFLVRKVTNENGDYVILSFKGIRENVFFKSNDVVKL